MSNLNKPPILDKTGQAIKSKLTDILQGLQNIGSGFIPTSQKGSAGGVAELDSNGKVPSAQLPSFVDDVVEGYYDNTTDRFYEESTFETVIPPVDGKSWVDVTANKSYRWTGSVYVRVDEGVQLGETSSTAYRGDRGKTAYDHSQSDHSAVVPAFTEASTRANILSGESFATLFGKIKKFFSDLKAVAFSGSYNDLSDKPTIPVATSTLSKTDNSHCPTSQAVFDLLEPIDETSYANLTEAQKNNGKAYFRYAAQNIIRPIQDDGTATDLVSGNLPTGQTIKSYLNGNFVQFEEVSDLNKPLTDNVITSLCMYRSSAANKPTSNAGVVLTYVPSANSYSAQFAFELGGQIWYRLRNGSGAISAWAQKA